MLRSDDESTRPSLLNRVRDRLDHPAWAEFVAYYDPMLRRWCRHYGFGEEASDELSQRIWERVWPLVLTFEYDLGRRFRGWLWRIFHSRAVDLRAEQDANPSISLESLPVDEGPLAPGELGFDPSDPGAPEAERETESLPLFREAEEAQAAVRGARRSGNLASVLAHPDRGTARSRSGRCDGQVLRGRLLWLAARRRQTPS